MKVSMVIVMRRCVSCVCFVGDRVPQVNLENLLLNLPIERELKGSGGYLEKITIPCLTLGAAIKPSDSIELLENLKRSGAGDLRRCFF